MNRAEISGGLVRDPALNYLPSGVAVCSFTVAVKGARWDHEAQADVVTSEFISVEAWDSLAEEVTESGLARGDTVYVLGSLSQTEYEDREGKKQRKTRIRAEVVSGVRVKTASNRPVRTRAKVEDPWGGPPPPPPYDDPYAT